MLVNRKPTRKSSHTGFLKNTLFNRESGDGIFVRVVSSSSGSPGTRLSQSFPLSSLASWLDVWVYHPTSHNGYKVAALLQVWHEDDIILIENRRSASVSSRSSL